MKNAPKLMGVSQLFRLDTPINLGCFMPVRWANYSLFFCVNTLVLTTP